jgi:Zn-dependent M16 (insulinase) family peptidase
MWNAVRGGGLAYSVSFDMKVESRHITFCIIDSPNAAAAFTAASHLIQDVVAKKVKITKTMLEAAKSGLAFDIVEGLSTPPDAVSCTTA